MRRASMMALAGLGMPFVSLAARAQSCALCYTNVAGGGPAAVSALHKGIISLLVPALLLFLGLCWLIVRRAQVASNATQPRPASARVPVHFAVAPDTKPVR